MKEVVTEVFVIDGMENIIHYPKVPDPKDLEHLYDVMNEISKDKSEMFYTHEEVEEFRKNGTKIFI